MVTVTERWGSRRWKGGQIPAVELEFIIKGTTNDAIATQALLATAPPTYANLPRKEYSLERLGDDAWMGTVQYSGLEQQDFGLISLEFRIGTENTKLMQSINTVASYPAPGQTAPNFQGAINVSANGVEGVEIAIPTFEWSETWRHPDQTINGLAYGGTLYTVTGRVNNAPFRGFAAGEVLFRGAEGRKTRHDAWEFSYHFAASPNATNLRVGPITGISKKGWEYLWVLYHEKEDDNAKSLVQVPRAVYIEQVYPTANFSVLGIGR